jgi:hypothetical protein
MISADQFKSRLEVLCLRGGGRGLPRKPRDRHILFKSIVLMLDPEKIYSETVFTQQRQARKENQSIKRREPVRGHNLACVK